MNADRLDGFTVLPIDEGESIPFRVGHVGIAPMGHGDHHRLERQSFFGKPILGVSGSWGFLQHTGLHQLLQAVAQHIAGDAEALLELVEATQAEERVPDDQHGPVFADYREGLGQ